MAGDNRTAIPEDIEFIDADNYQGGNKGDISFSSIVANQVSRITQVASELPTMDGDKLPYSILALASLLDGYLQKEEHKTFRDKIDKLDKQITELKNTHKTEINKLKAQSQSHRIDVAQYSAELNELRLILTNETRELYLLINAELVKLWGAESYFKEESATG